MQEHQQIINMSISLTMWCWLLHESIFHNQGAMRPVFETAKQHTLIR